MRRRATWHSPGYFSLKCVWIPLILDRDYHTLKWNTVPWNWTSWMKLMPVVFHIEPCPAAPNAKFDSFSKWISSLHTGVCLLCFFFRCHGEFHWWWILGGTIHVSIQCFWARNLFDNNAWRNFTAADWGAKQISYTRTARRTRWKETKKWKLRE